MSRFRRLDHAVIVVLFLVVAAHLLVGACNDESDPVRATPAELVANQESYHGRVVQTSGVVRRFGEAEGATRVHYVVEDEEANRVALVPNAVAERYTGQEVLVVGSFRFHEEEGRSIEIEHIERR